MVTFTYTAPSNGTVDPGAATLNGTAGTDKILLDNAGGPGNFGIFDLRDIDVTGGIEEIEFNADGINSDKYLYLSNKELDQAGEFASNLLIDGNANTGSNDYIRIYIEDAYNSGNVDISGWTFQDWNTVAFPDQDYIYLYGTATANTIEASSQMDYLYGYGGNDTLYGNGGTDRLYGGDGYDYLYGGNGADYLYAGNGGGIMNGGSGNDFLYGGTGTDYLGYLGTDTGSDYMTGYGGNDYYYVDSAGDTEVEAAGGGTDTVYAYYSGYTLAANIENLYLQGTVYQGTGNGLANTIGGNSSSNALYGGAGNDNLYGYGGNDYLYGGSGTVNSYGGDGNDYFYDGNFGTGDAFYGGAGDDDTLIADTTWNDAVLYDLTSGWMKYPGSTGTLYDTLSSIENLWVGGGADVIGSSADNYIYIYDTGGSSNNEISTLGGDDLIYSGIGNDEINAGSGEDTVYGGAGNDIITDTETMGASNDDYYDGGAGTDTLVHDLGWVSTVKFDLNAGWASYSGNRDRLISIENLVVGGSAQVIGSGGDNVITVNGTGNNIIAALGGNDTVYANGGDDDVKGGNGNDSLYGGDGNDSLDGDNDNDFLYGGNGNDYLLGRQGTDYLYGGAGNDELDGEYMYGGSGNDEYRMRSTSNVVSESVGGGTDTVYSSANIFALAANVENLTLLSPAYFGYGNGINNVITGTSGKNKLDGLGGNDVVYGGGNIDYVFGGDGDDFIYGGAGNDGVFAGEGVDWVFGDAGNDKVGGGAGNDFVYGGTGDDILTGDNNQDVLYGGDGNDILDGGSVRDTMYGDAGNDLIYGGVGIDQIYGGSGNDQFVYNDVSWSGPGASADTVHDFENPGNALGDRFNLSGIDANVFAGGNQAFSYGGSQGAGPVNTGTGYFWFANVGNDTHLRANNDGGSYDLDIVIDDGIGLVAANYNSFDVIG